MTNDNTAEDGMSRQYRETIENFRRSYRPTDVRWTGEGLRIHLPPSGMLARDPNFSVDIDFIEACVAMLAGGKPVTGQMPTSDIIVLSGEGAMNMAYALKDAGFDFAGSSALPRRQGEKITAACRQC